MRFAAAVSPVDAKSPAVRLVASAKGLACLVGCFGSRCYPEGFEGPVLKPPPYARLIGQPVDATLLKVCPPFGALPGGQYVSAVAVVNADAYTFRSLLPNPCAVLAFLPLPDGVENICR